MTSFHDVKKYRGFISLQTSLIELAKVYLFVMRVLREMFTPPIETREILRQCYQIGYKTLLLIGFTSFIAGMVFTRQARPSP